MMYLSQVPTNAPFQSADLQQLQVDAMAPTAPPAAPAPIPPIPEMPTNGHPHAHGVDSYTPGAQADLDFLNSMLSNPHYQASMPSFTNGNGIPDGNALLSETYVQPSLNAGDVLMSDQWMSLMQETGLFEGVEGMNENFTPNLFSF